MRLCLAQMNIVWESKEDNISRYKKVLDKVSGKVDMVLFPEMSLTGFSMNTDVTKDDGSTIKIFKNLSKEYSVIIGIGYVEKVEDKESNKAENKAENHYAVINGDEVVLDYAKIHPFSYSDEDKFFKGGDSLGLGNISGWNIGCGICYDLRFPELFQALSKTAELIIVPANWPGKRRTHWMTLLRARAIENQCYMVGVNCGGDINGLSYSGDSAVYSPNGDEVEVKELIKLEDSSEDEKILIVEIDNDVDSYREGFPVKKDRREDLYKEFMLRYVL